MPPPAVGLSKHRHTAARQGAGNENAHRTRRVKIALEAPGHPRGQRGTRRRARVPPPATRSGAAVMVLAPIPGTHPEPRHTTEVGFRGRAGDPRDPRLF